MPVVDLLLRGGLVVDGTGSPPRRTDVAISDGLVAAIGDDLDLIAPAEVDAAGRLVCPGFVDIHTHSDLTLLSAPHAPSKVRQGVTTEVVGNCGLGLAPVDGDADATAVRAATGYLDRDPSVAVSWAGMRAYLAAVAAAAPAINVASFVAHLPVHAGAAGFGADPATARQRDRMCEAVDRALDEGAVGLSTGLVYAPLCFADEAELVALAEVVAARGAVFAWHARDYGDELVPSIEQVLRVARKTGVRTQISHLTAVGRRNWSKVPEVLAMVTRAREDGVDVGVDIYPYTAGNAPLSQLLPDWAQTGGDEAIRARLAEAGVRARVLAAWEDRPLGWDEIVVSAAPEPDRATAGRSVAELADAESRDGGEIVLDLLRRHGGAVMMVAHGRSEEELRRVLSYSHGMVASDGQALDPDGPTGRDLTHPRSYGCFPRYLDRYAGDDIADAVRRCTSAPADRVRLDRGRLVEGAVADVVVLDPMALRDHATFEDPHVFPTGIDLVLVRGEAVVVGDRATGARPGSILTPTNP